MTATATKAPTVSIPRQTLRTALSKVLAAVDTSSKALPVAQHILLQAREHTLTMTSTNFDAFVRLSVPCQCDGDGAVLLPGKLLAEIVANLPPVPSLTIAFDVPTPGRATITAGRSTFELVGLPPAEFPALTDVTSEAVDVIADVFIDALMRCVTHSSDAPSRPALNGVLVEREGDSFVVVGCEGTSLARLPGGAASGAPFPRQCSIPRQSVPMLARIFGGLPDEEPVRLSIDGARLQLSTVDMVAHVRLVEHDYPAYRQLLPKSHTHVAICDRLLLATAVKRVALTANEQGRVLLTIDGEELRVRADHTDRGAASDTVPLESSRGSGIQFGMNATLMGKALATLTAERVHLAINGPELPLLITPAEQDTNDPTLLLVMPLRAID